MKTSFYFVVWILVYPLLGLNNPATPIYQYSFLFALIAVFVLAKVLDALMPKTHRYESEMPKLRLFEDVYSGNTKSLVNHLTVNFWISLVTSIYCVAAVVALLCSTDVSDQIFAIIVFAGLAGKMIYSAYAFFSWRRHIASDPLTGGAAEVLSEMYPSEYELFKDSRKESSFEELCPPRPTHYKATVIWDVLMAGVAVWLGLVLIIASFFGGTDWLMVFLYGGLALYFGISDSISCGRFLIKEGFPKWVLPGLAVGSLLLAAGATAYIYFDTQRIAVYQEIDASIEQANRMLPANMGNVIIENIVRHGNTVTKTIRVTDVNTWNLITQTSKDPRYSLFGTMSEMADNKEFLDGLGEHNITLKYVYYNTYGEKISVTLTPEDIKRYQSLTDEEINALTFEYNLIKTNYALPIMMEDGSVLTSIYVNEHNNLVLSFQLPTFDREYLRANKEGIIDEIRYRISSGQINMDLVEGVDVGLEYHFIERNFSDSIALKIYAPYQMKTVLRSTKSVDKK